MNQNKLNLASKSTNFIHRLIYLHIYVLPLSFFWYTFNIGSSFIMFIGYLTILTGIIFLINGKIKRIPPFTFLLLIYFIYKVISDYLFDMQMEGDIFRVLKYSSPYLAFFFFLLLIENTYNIPDKLILRANRVIIATVFIAPIVSIIQVFNTDFTLIANKILETGYESIYQIRRSSIFDLESNTAFTLSFIPMLALVVSSLIKYKNLKYMAYLMVLASIPVFLSNTRVVMVGYFIVIILILVQSKGFSMGIFRFIIIFFFIAASIYLTLNLFGYNLDLYYNERIKEGPLDDSPRYDSYIAFLNVFPKYPIWGTGNPTADVIANSLSKGRNFIHIGWLSHLATFGIIGSLFFFVFIYQLMKFLYKSAKNSNFYAPLFAFTIYIVANFTFVEINLFTSGLILSLVYSRYYTIKSQGNFIKS